MSNPDIWTKAEDGTLVAEISALQHRQSVPRVVNDYLILGRGVVDLRTRTKDRNLDGEIMGWRFVHEGQWYLIIND